MPAQSDKLAGARGKARGLPGLWSRSASWGTEVLLMLSVWNVCNQTQRQFGRVAVRECALTSASSSQRLQVQGGRADRFGQHALHWFLAEGDGDGAVRPMGSQVFLQPRSQAYAHAGVAS